MLEALDLNAILALLRDFMTTIGTQISSLLATFIGFDVGSSGGILIVCLIIAYVMKGKLDSWIMMVIIAAVLWLVSTGSIVI